MQLCTHQTKPDTPLPIFIDPGKVGDYGNQVKQTKFKKSRKFVRKSHPADLFFIVTTVFIVISTFLRRSAASFGIYVVQKLTNSAIGVVRHHDYGPFSEKKNAFHDYTNDKVT